jgi:hypothetical protein
MKWLCSYFPCYVYSNDGRVSAPDQFVAVFTQILFSLAYFATGWSYKHSNRYAVGTDSATSLNSVTTYRKISGDLPKLVPISRWCKLKFLEILAKMGQNLWEFVWITKNFGIFSRNCGKSPDEKVLISRFSKRVGGNVDCVIGKLGKKKKKNLYSKYKLGFGIVMYTETDR